MRSTYKTGLLLAFTLFLIGSYTLLAFHHHDYAFQLPYCAICKAKGFVYSPSVKYHQDVPALLTNQFMSGLPYLIGDLDIATPNYFKAYIPIITCNKAPPLPA